MKLRTAKLSALGVIVMGLILWGPAGGAPPVTKRLNTGLADANSLINQYNKWFTANARSGMDRFLTIKMGWVRGMTPDRFSRADAILKVDYQTGMIIAQANRLPEGEGEWQLWLINNRENPGNSTMPDASDAMLSLGVLTQEGDSYRLSTSLDRQTLIDFSIDRVVLTRAGENPANSFVLTGAPTLFERLQRKHFNQLKGSEIEQVSDSSSKDWFSMATVEAQSSGMEALVAKGRDLFLNEQFSGNGRTCGTCHRENNNFTIDPDFIATLPPNDPLFVAEFNPALSKNFEKPEMMRKFGLFVENVDGMEDLDKKFVLRAANHTLALPTSIKAPPTDPAEAAKLFIDFASLSRTERQTVQRLGWGGDGAPGSGSLREFAIGAVIQHFTKSLGRKAGTDFRLPTDVELDAMEAFQLSLGRNVEFDLPSVQFRYPLASQGKDLFLGAKVNDGGVTKKCTICHFAAGSTFTVQLFIDPFDCINCFPLGFNSSVGIGADVLPERIQAGLPPDGGFGTEPLPAGTFGIEKGAFGDCDGPKVFGLPFCVAEFSTPPLIESPDTAPYFHNHMKKTLEDTIAHYGSDTFNKVSEAGNFQFPPGNPIVPIQLTTSETNAIGAFIRTLNVLENIRSAIATSQRAKSASTSKDAQQMLSLAASEAEDAFQVITNPANPALRALFLQERSPVFIAGLRINTAKSMLDEAALTSDAAARNSLVDKAIKQLRVSRGALVKSESLPVEYQN
jgi:cytochrome c peroxidase